MDGLERIKQIPDNVIIRALEIMIDALVEKYDELGMRDTGEWARELEGVVEGDKAIIKGLPYTEQLVDGREPGKAPPVQAMRNWVQSKLGISGEQNINRVAYLVGQKIAKEGTNIYQRGGSTLLEDLEDPKLLKLFSNEIEAHVKLELNEAFVTMAKQLKA